LRTDEESIDESIRIFVTNYLLMQADRLFLPTPPYEDEKMWTQVDSGERRVLTALGISSVRTAMRAELAQRREFFLKVLAALTGVIGAATGLLAIWLKRK